MKLCEFYGAGGRRRAWGRVTACQKRGAKSCGKDVAEQLRAACRQSPAGGLSGGLGHRRGRQVVWVDPDGGRLESAARRAKVQGRTDLLVVLRQPAERGVPSEADAPVGLGGAGEQAVSRGRACWPRTYSRAAPSRLLVFRARWVGLRAGSLRGWVRVRWRPAQLTGSTIHFTATS